MVKTARPFHLPAALLVLLAGGGLLWMKLRRTDEELERRGREMETERNAARPVRPPLDSSPAHVRESVGQMPQTARDGSAAPAGVDLHMLLKQTGPRANPVPPAVEPAPAAVPAPPAAR